MPEARLACPFTVASAQTLWFARSRGSLALGPSFLPSFPPPPAALSPRFSMGLPVCCADRLC